MRREAATLRRVNRILRQRATYQLSLRARFGNFYYDLDTHDTAWLAFITKGAIHVRMKGTEFVGRADDLRAIDPGSRLYLCPLCRAIS